MTKSKLQEKYEKEIMATLATEFGIKNKMAIPAVQKVVINAGIGSLIKNKEAVDSLKKDFAAITGQYPALKTAKVSIASFNLRRGMIVGLSVTLRGARMYSFLERFFSITLPRLRDFRGVSLKSFDKSGNYTMGVEDHTIFPEIDMTKATAHGMEITIVINSKDVEQSRRLLDLMGMPFEK